MKIIIVGLGKMGSQIAQQVLDAGHQVIAMDPNQANVKQVVDQGGQAVDSRTMAVETFSDSGQLPTVWLMVPSGVVDTELQAWLEVLPAESIVVDGGNSDFRLTRNRAEAASLKGVHLVDVGVSGGVLGLTNGFSMMVGGNQAAFLSIEPILQAMAKAQGGYHYFGPAGAGHFIKMAHNAVEYGMMESLAEGYRLIHDGPYENLDLAAIGDVWQRSSVIESNLNGLAAKALQANPKMADIEGFVAESGEARWALEVAQENNVDMPAIQASFDVRLASQQGKINFATKLLAALRNQFGGHAINKDT